MFYLKQRWPHRYLEDQKPLKITEKDDFFWLNLSMSRPHLYSINLLFIQFFPTDVVNAIGLSCPFNFSPPFYRHSMQFLFTSCWLTMPAEPWLCEHVPAPSSPRSRNLLWLMPVPLLCCESSPLTPSPVVQIFYATHGAAQSQGAQVKVNYKQRQQQHNKAGVATMMQCHVEMQLIVREKFFVDATRRGRSWKDSARLSVNMTYY